MAPDTSAQAVGFLGFLAGIFCLAAACTHPGSLAANAAPAAPREVTRATAAALPPDEDGYELWLRYPRVKDPSLRAQYAAAFRQLLAEHDSPTLAAALDELERGLGGLVGAKPARVSGLAEDGTIVLGTPQGSALIAAAPFAAELPAKGREGFLVRQAELRGHHVLVIAANSDVGVLYGTFALLRQLQSHVALAGLALDAAPRIATRMLDHWDNLDRSVERGYAGASLWEWDDLPGKISPRYRDYARANASIGINGVALTNVNASAQVLTPAYLQKVKALADVLRPYGQVVYLTARFSAPIELGGLATADPLAPQVAGWWRAKADEIYALVPDFGGFLVKANSEGQPGPQDYQRTHADGANMLADAVGPHGGRIIWRAFVYGAGAADRIRQAYDEFQPLDGEFRPNVLLQVKNGPLDFQPREPQSPLFGSMPRTPLALELQITKEYLGQDTHLVYLGPLYEEVLRADTYERGPGSTIAKIVDGSLERHEQSLIAGVANVGSDRNWCGSHFNQANWYVFGRMAWDPSLSARSVAEEWVRLTFSTDPDAVTQISDMMLSSREAAVNYMTPLGLVHLMATGHHYGPGPWVNNLPRADWNPVYYHRADRSGIGFDRTRHGSNAVAQYLPPLRAQLENLETVPDELLLFFHHVPWSYRMRSGRTLWAELVHRYDAGVEAARALGTEWDAVRSKIDARRFSEVATYLKIQAYEARWWRDASLSYFGSVSGLPLPEGEVPPRFSLDFYEHLDCPKDRTRPRCEAVYVDSR